MGGCAGYGTDAVERLDLPVALPKPLNEKVSSRPKPRFEADQPVYARSFGKDDPVWVEGRIISPRGRALYEVQTALGRCIRHKNQLRPRKPFQVPWKYLLETGHHRFVVVAENADRE